MRTRPFTSRAPRKGDVITARFLGDVVRTLNTHSRALLHVVEDTAAPNDDAASTTSTGNPVIVTARFQSMSSNSWTGQRLDTQESITVTKPVELQGFGATRVVEGEDQVIVPPYSASNDSLVIFAESGEWHELSPRHWAREFAVVT